MTTAKAEVLDEFNLDIQIDETDPPARNNAPRTQRDPDTELTVCSCSWCCPTRPTCQACE